MKNVSINKWEKMIEKHEKSVMAKVHTKANPEDEGIEVEVKIGMPIEARMAFAKNVVESCFSELDGQFVPYAWTVAWNLYLVSEFTNITISKDYDKMMAFIQDTDIIEVITAKNRKLINDLWADVEDLMDFEKERHSHSAKVDEVCDGIMALIDMFAESMDDISAKIEDGSIDKMLAELKPSNVIDLKTESKGE